MQSLCVATTLVIQTGRLLWYLCGAAKAHGEDWEPRQSGSVLVMGGVCNGAAGYLPLMAILADSTRPISCDPVLYREWPHSGVFFRQPLGPSGSPLEKFCFLRLGVSSKYTGFKQTTWRSFCIFHNSLHSVSACSFSNMSKIIAQVYYTGLQSRKAQPYDMLQFDMLPYNGVGVVPNSFRGEQC